MSIWNLIRLSFKSLKGQRVLLPVLVMSVGLGFMLLAAKDRAVLTDADNRTSIVEAVSGDIELTMGSISMLTDLPHSSGMTPVCELSVVLPASEQPVYAVAIRPDYLERHLNDRTEPYSMTEGSIVTGNTGMIYGTANKALTDTLDSMDGTASVEEIYAGAELADGTPVRITGIIDDRAERPMIYLDFDAVRQQLQPAAYMPELKLRFDAATETDARALTDELRNRGYTVIRTPSITDEERYYYEFKYTRDLTDAVLAIISAVIIMWTLEALKRERESEVRHSYIRLGVRTSVLRTMAIIRWMIMLAAAGALGTVFSLVMSLYS